MKEKTYPRVSNAIWLTVLVIVLMVGIGVLAGFIVGLSSALTGMSDAIETMAMSVGTIIATIAAFLIVLRRFYRKSSINPMVFARMHAISLLAAAGFLALTTGMIILSSEIHNLVVAVVPYADWFSGIMEQLMVQPIFMALVTIAVLPALLEEFLFRGCLTLGLRRNAGRTTTLVASSLLFGLVHLNPWQFFPAAFIGAILGWLALRTGSILLPIVAHFLNNALAVLVTNYEFILPIRGFNPAYDGPGIFQPLPFTLAGLLLLVSGFAILKRTLPSAPELPQSENHGIGPEMDAHHP